MGLWKTMRRGTHEKDAGGRCDIARAAVQRSVAMFGRTSTSTIMRLRRSVFYGFPAAQLGLMLTGLWGCSLMDPGQDIPSYLIVPEMSYSPGEDQGTASTNVTDVWVYSATDVVGVFPLPAVIPILPTDASGGAVTLLAGIRENGISNSRAPYPFYTTAEHLINPEPGAQDTLVPEFTLVEQVKYMPIEDFENSNVFGSMVGGSGLVRVGAEAEVFEGEKSGRMEVSEDVPIVRVRTVEQEFDLQSGLPAFLELDYRCDQSFAVGLYGFRSGNETKHLTLVINPTEEVGGATAWNKLYVDLASTISAQGPADHFEVYFECILEAGREQGSVGLDNLRILTY